MKLKLLLITLTLSSLMGSGKVHAQKTQALINEAIENYLFDQINNGIRKTQPATCNFRNFSFFNSNNKGKQTGNDFQTKRNKK